MNLQLRSTAFVTGTLFLALSCSGANAAATPAMTPSTAQAPAAVPGSGIVGPWFGTLDVGHIKLRLALNVREQEGGRVATIDSIDQGASRIPIASVIDTEGGARLELPVIGAVFAGEYNADGSQLAGTWQQGGNSLPLVFHRLEKPFTVARPQEPKKPYPYRAEELTFPQPRDRIKLAGTLTLPAGGGPHPAVVLISGSGPQDRNESLMGHKPFLVLADHLTRAGIAVLRYDDRGVGRSQGNHLAATHVDFASDARAAFAYLQTRPEIDPQRIGLLGHSEGSIHAPLAAAEEPDVAFMVFLAGVGVPLPELLERQTVDLLKLQGIDYEPSPEVRALNDAMYERMRTLPDDPETPAFLRAKAREGFALMPDEIKQALGLTDALFESRLQAITTPWFIRLAVYDPRPALMKIDCPVLAVNGTKDVQVAADENLAAIKAAIAAGGNTAVTVRKFPGLNHLFQSATTGAISEYGTIEETMSPEVLTVVSEWILAQVGGGPR